MEEREGGPLPHCSLSLGGTSEMKPPEALGVLTAQRLLAREHNRRAQSRAFCQLWSEGPQCREKGAGPGQACSFHAFLSASVRPCFQSDTSGTTHPSRPRHALYRAAGSAMEGRCCSRPRCNTHSPSPALPLSLLPGSGRRWTLRAPRPASSHPTWAAPRAAQE